MGKGVPESASLRAAGFHLLPGIQEGPVALSIRSGLAAGWASNPASGRRWGCLGLFSLSYVISELYFFFLSWWLSLQRCTCSPQLWFLKRFMNTFPMGRESFFSWIIHKCDFCGFFYCKGNLSAQLFTSCLLFWQTSKSLPGHPFPFLLNFDGIWVLGILGKGEKKKEVREVTFTVEMP